MHLRPVTAADRPAVLQVESLATPNLHYLDAVYDDWRRDEAGEFMLVEQAGEVQGCAKFTVQPDGSAWLEALRVSPAAQGQGLGKRMYGRFFELAQERGIGTLRMYTGISNRVSKGLAEHFGFELEETFAGYLLSVQAETPLPPTFTPLHDVDKATALLMASQPSWGEFVVLNRTFYRLTPQLCGWLAGQGMVYTCGDSVVVLGARFSPEKALQIGLFAGDLPACLAFAQAEAGRRGVPRLHCLCATSAKATRAALENAGFGADPGEYIVMKVEQL